MGSIQLFPQPTLFCLKIFATDQLKILQRVNLTQSGFPCFPLSGRKPT